MNVTRRSLLQAGAPAILGCAPPRRPNILFVLSDDQRRDTVSALGNPAIRTPNLDRLVRRGVSFDNAYCMGGFSPAVCLPSRMMVLRGRSWFASQRMKEATPNLPDTFNRAGYATWHMGKRGNVDLKGNALFQHNQYLEPDDATERLRGRPAQQIAGRAAAFLRQWKAGGGSRPFFMYLADSSPHDPRVAPAGYVRRYVDAKLPLPKNFRPFHDFDNGDLLVRDEKLAPWPRTESEIRRHLAEYYAVITYMDEQLGRVFDTLAEIGEQDNTIVVFSADQGIAIGSHGLMGKQNLYQPSLNAPLVFAGPGIPQGKRTASFAYLFDIFPTLCDLAGVAPPEGLEGRSQARAIRGGKPVRDTIFLAYRDIQRAVRRGRWKLIHYPKINRTQLFDLRADPDEVRDLSSSHGARVKELMLVLAEEQKLYGDAVALGSSRPDGGRIGLDYFRAVTR